MTRKMSNFSVEITTLGMHRFSCIPDIGSLGSLLCQSKHPALHHLASSGLLSVRPQIKHLREG